MVKGKMNFVSGISKRIFAHIIFRFIQMIMGVVVIGLYAQDLNRAHKEGKYSDGKWVFATVTGSLSAVTALVYMVILFVSSNLAIAILSVWDFILFVLWIAVFGIFGQLYIKTTTGGESGIARMKNAVWIDLVNLFLWLISTVVGALLLWQGRRGKSLHTGRAEH